jgi:hypothetical protein
LRFFKGPTLAGFQAAVSFQPIVAIMALFRVINCYVSNLPRDPTQQGRGTNKRGPRG